MPYGITQCYLPPGRGDIPALTPAEAGTGLSDPGGMQACTLTKLYSDDLMLVILYWFEQLKKLNIKLKKDVSLW